MAASPIPRRIFQTWKSKTDLPENFAVWRNSFIAKNPSYHFDLWDDADNRRFIAEHFKWFLKAYDSYPAEIYRADMVRYFYLYMYGGLYVDLDTQCLKPLDAVLEQSGVILGRLASTPYPAESIPNAIMASSPGEEFWLYLIARAMTEAGRTEGPAQVTGPALLFRALQSYAAGDPRPADVVGLLSRLLPPHLLPKPGVTPIHILPPAEWYPLSWSEKSEQHKRVLAGEHLSQAEAEKLFPESSLVTYWAHSWGAA